MITLKRVNGQYIVTVDGKQVIFDILWEAWEFIYTEYSRRVRASL